MSTDFFAAGLPTGPVEIDPEVRPYWDGAANGDLVLPFCKKCLKYFWYPRGFCPRCGHDDLTWQISPGRGEVYSFTIVHQGFGRWAEHSPFVVAYVTLSEGITVTTNVIDCPADKIAVGTVVQAVFEQAEPDDQPALRFRPVH